MSHYIVSYCGFAHIIWYEIGQTIEICHPIHSSTLISMNEIPIQSIKFGKKGDEDSINYYTITYTDGSTKVKDIID